MPLWILLIPYAIFLLVFIVFSLIDLWHAWRFRSGFFSALFLMAFYLAGALTILLISYQLLGPLDWMQTVGFTIAPTPFSP